MRTTATVFIATSLDGFIARNDGDIEWLNEASAGIPEGEDLGYAALMAEVDVLVMGRKTFEQVLQFGQWPYGETEVVVMSRRGVEIPVELARTVSSSSAAPSDLFAELAARAKRKLYVDGGQVIQAFLSAGLIDEIVITLVPILLGEGIPLFGPLDRDLPLELVSCQACWCSFAQLKYRVVRDGQPGELMDNG